MKKLTNLLKRIVLRDESELQNRAASNTKVCMVVWNTFETDARVMKEATSLYKKGKKVTVIAVHDIRRTQRYEVKQNIVIRRIDRTFRKKELVNKPVKSVSAATRATTKRSMKSRLKSKLKKVLSPLFVFKTQLIINVKFFLYAYKEHAGIYHANDLNTLVPTYFAAKLRGALCVYDAHEVSTDRAGWKNKWLWKAVENYFIKKANIVITTNQTRADFFAKEYNIEPPYIIKNVPPYQTIGPSNRIREQLQIPDDMPVILYQGGIQRDRGLENIIKIVPLVKTGVFVFIGNGGLKPKLKQLVAETNVTERVFFIDAVPNEELLSYTASANIGLQLLENTCFNHYSACSNKINEYLMAEIPVVCSDLPELKKVVEAVNFGLLVDPKNLQQIAQQINKLLADQKLTTVYKQNAKKHKKNYSWTKEERKLHEIYNLV